MRKFAECTLYDRCFIGDSVRAFRHLHSGLEFKNVESGEVGSEIYPDRCLMYESFAE